MLNLLPWIFYLFRGFRLLEHRENSPKKDVPCIELCKEKFFVGEESSSLEEIVEDATWKAVGGLSPIVEDDCKILSVNQEENCDDLNKSFGDIIDGVEDSVRKAVLMRSQSEQSEPKYNANKSVISEHFTEVSDSVQCSIVEEIWTETFYETTSSISTVDSESAARQDSWESTPRKDSWNSLNVRHKKAHTLSSSSSQSGRVLNSLQEAEGVEDGEKLNGNAERLDSDSNGVNVNGKDSPKKIVLRSHVKENNERHTESPKAVYNEFDEVMHRRKLHTDIMHQISDRLGHFGNREEKIFGSPSATRSAQLWQKVRKAVEQKKYLTFGNN